MLLFVIFVLVITAVGASVSFTNLLDDYITTGKFNIPLFLFGLICTGLMLYATAGLAMLLRSA